MEDVHNRLREFEGQLKNVSAKLDALARIVLRVFDFDGSMSDLVNEGRAPTTLEKDRFRSALLYASEMHGIRDEIKEALQWVKEQRAGAAGHREARSQLIRGLVTGVLGTLVGVIASHFWGAK